MKRIIIIAIILVSLTYSSVAMANIYTWTDEKGLRHFSNQSPPSGADIFIEESGRAPISTPIEDSKVENSNPPAASKSIESNINDTQDNPLETTKQGDVLKHDIRSTDYNQKQTAETVEYGSGYGKSLNNRSYLTPEDTPSENTSSEDDYDDPDDNIHRTDMTNTSGYYRLHRRQDKYRRHSGSYGYRKYPYAGYDRRYKSYYMYRYGNHNVRDRFYKNRQHGKYNHRRPHHSRIHKQGSRLSTHQNRRHYQRRHFYGSSQRRTRRLGMH